MKRRDFLWTSVWAGGAWSLIGTHAGASGDAQGHEPHRVSRRPVGLSQTGVV
jgi:hypothetical protein